VLSGGRGCSSTASRRGPHGAALVVGVVRDVDLSGVEPLKGAQIVIDETGRHFLDVDFASNPRRQFCRTKPSASVKGLSSFRPRRSSS
jgi:hypothetical protein